STEPDDTIVDQQRWQARPAARAPGPSVHGRHRELAPLVRVKLRFQTGKRSPGMGLPAQRRMHLSGGTELAYVTAGDPSNPALLLLHGFPSSARTFRDVLPGLARAAYVIAPDLS